jgi:hypothetical protein
MDRLPIPTGHPDYEIVPEKDGYAVLHKTSADHGGMGAIRFASTEKEALDQLESLKKANGDA